MRLRNITNVINVMEYIIFNRPCLEDVWNGTAPIQQGFGQSLPAASIPTFRSWEWNLSSANYWIIKKYGNHPLKEYRSQSMLHKMYLKSSWNHQPDTFDPEITMFPCWKPGSTNPSRPASPQRNAAARRSQHFAPLTMSALLLGIHGSVSKPCTPGEHQNSW